MLIVNIFMSTINMLIPDLLNILFDQSDYQTLTILRSINRRKTFYANKYSLLTSYEFRKHHPHDKKIYLLGRMKVIKQQAKNMDIHKRNDHMLRWCAIKNHLEAVKYLISIGANIHAKDDYLLRIFASRGQLQVVKYLVHNGANIHAQSDVALGWAVRQGHLETAKYFIQLGCTEFVTSAMLVAAKHGRTNVVRHFIENGVDVHIADDYALRISAKNQHMETVEYLISVGADVHANDNEIFEYPCIVEYMTK